MKVCNKDQIRNLKRFNIFVVIQMSLFLSTRDVYSSIGLYIRLVENAVVPRLVEGLSVAFLKVISLSGTEAVSIRVA